MKLENHLVVASVLLLWGVCEEEQGACMAESSSQEIASRSGWLVDETMHSPRRAIQFR